MRKLAAAGMMALLTTIPTEIAAQGMSVGIGAHVGLNGYGAEAAIGVGRSFDIRGGISFAPEDHFMTKLIRTDISGVDYELNLPGQTIRAGVDLHVLGPLKLMGGILYRTEDLSAKATVTQSIELGGQTFNNPGTVTATLDQNNVIPYAGIGFGHLTTPGIGVYLDLGLAYSGDSEVVLKAEGELGSQPGIQQALQAEVDEFLADQPTFLKKIYPVLEIGVKIGLGG